MNKPVFMSLCHSFRSYGVTMWEMTQLCRQPYHWLTDEQVLEKVISKRTECLPLPYYAEDKLNM